MLFLAGAFDRLGRMPTTQRDNKTSAGRECVRDGAQALVAACLLASASLRPPISSPSPIRRRWCSAASLSDAGGGCTEAPPEAPRVSSVSGPTYRTAARSGIRAPPASTIRNSRHARGDLSCLEPRRGQPSWGIADPATAGQSEYPVDWIYDRSPRVAAPLIRRRQYPPQPA